MVDHFVMFKFRDGTDPAVMAGFDRAVRQMADAVGLGSTTVVHDLGLRPGHPRAYDRGAMLSFPNTDAFDRFMASEAHSAFVTRWVEPHCQAVASMQYRAERPSDDHGSHPTPS